MRSDANLRLSARPLRPRFGFSPASPRNFVPPGSEPGDRPAHLVGSVDVG